MDSLTSSSKIGLFYCDMPNFGDLLSKAVVELMSGRPAAWASPAEADLCAIGSLFGLIHKRLAQKPRPADRRKLIVWGSGCMKPEPREILRNMTVVAVRGPITATLLGLRSDIPMGDPGLFAADLLDTESTKDDVIGIVPHHELAADPRLRDLVKQEAALRLIDVRTKDPIAVIRQIASCRFILSSSLHGLIVADSLGIPNEWLDPTGNHQCPELKFHDYAASIGRRLKRPMELGDIAARLPSLGAQGIGYADGIQESKEELRRSFESVRALLVL